MFPKRKNEDEARGGDGNPIALAEQRLATKVDTSKSPKRRGAGFALAVLVAATALAEAAPAQAQERWGQIAEEARRVGGVIGERQDRRTEDRRERGDLDAEIQRIDRSLMQLVGTANLTERMTLPNPTTIEIAVGDPRASRAEQAAAIYRDEIARARDAVREGRITAPQSQRYIINAGVSFQNEMASILAERDRLIVQRRVAESRLGTEAERRIEQGANVIGTVATILNGFSN